MSTIQINTPDGKVISLNAPDGATDDQIRNAAMMATQHYKTTVMGSSPAPAIAPTPLGQLKSDLANSNGVLGTANTLLKAPQKMSAAGLKMIANAIPNPEPTGNLPMDIARGTPRIAADTLAQVAPGFVSKGALLTAGAAKGLQVAAPILKLLAKGAGAQAESISGAVPGSFEAAYKAPILKPLQLQAGKSAASPMYDAAKAEMNGAASIFQGMSDPRKIVDTAQEYLNKGGQLEPSEALTARKAADLLLRSKNVVKDELLPLRDRFDQMAKASANIAEADPAYVQGRMADSLRQIVPQNMHGGASAFKMALGTALNNMGTVGKLAKFALSPAAVGAAATAAGDVAKIIGPAVDNPTLATGLPTVAKVLTEAMAKTFLKKAGGNKDKAREMATNEGWTIPE